MTKKNGNHKNHGRNPKRLLAAVPAEKIGEPGATAPMIPQGAIPPGAHTIHAPTDPPGTIVEQPAPQGGNPFDEIASRVASAAQAAANVAPGPRADWTATVGKREHGLDVTIHTPAAITPEQFHRARSAAQAEATYATKLNPCPVFVAVLCGGYAAPSTARGPTLIGAPPAPGAPS